MELNGQAALVTGGGSGLGAATARALAKAGAKVAVLDINEENARKVAGEIAGVAVKCTSRTPKAPRRRWRKRARRRPRRGC